MTVHCLHVQINSQVKEKAVEVSIAFRKERFATKRELNSLSQITGSLQQNVFQKDLLNCYQKFSLIFNLCCILLAEASKVFPPDFASVSPGEVFGQVCSTVCTFCCYYSRRNLKNCLFYGHLFSCRLKIYFDDEYVWNQIL